MDRESITTQNTRDTTPYNSRAAEIIVERWKTESGVEHQLTGVQVNSAKRWGCRRPHLTLKYTYDPIFTSRQPLLQNTHNIRDRGGVYAHRQRSIHTTNFGRPNRPENCAAF